MMKRCPVCNTHYDDYVEMCPDCEIHLIEIETPNPAARTRRTVIRAEAPLNKSTSRIPYSPPDEKPLFQRGRDINPARHEAPAGPQYVRPAHNPSRAVFAAAIRRYFPVLLLIGAIAAIAINWAGIKEILSTMLTGAVIGGFMFAFFSFRRGGIYANNSAASGAVLGSIAALLFRYNVLGINIELAEIISAAMPVSIIIAAIHFMIRSIL